MNEIRDDNVIVTIKWTYEDLENALKDRGYEPTGDNIETLLSNKLASRLEDESIEKGWDIIDYIFCISEDQLE
jgi:hypothetical protein